jgi:SAM-dependent methyltransferase
MISLNGKLFLLALSALSLLGYQQAQPARQSAKPSVYETRADHDPDGIGKFYMGREIAHVMGYQGAEWLERPERIEEERPDQVVEQMKLKPADAVADIGAGTGYFSFRISGVVKQGKVFAVDIQPEMLAVIEKRRKDSKVENVIAVKSEEADAKLPDNSVDAG